MVIDEIMRQQHQIVDNIKSNEQRLLIEQKKEPILWNCDTIKKLDEGIPNLSVNLSLRFVGPYKLDSMKKPIGKIDHSNFKTILFDLNIIVFPEEKTFSILRIGKWFDLQVHRIASPSGSLSQYTYITSFENGNKSENAHSTNPLICRSNIWQKEFLNLCSQIF